MPFGVSGDIPVAGIEGFRGTEIERKLGDDLPAEAEIGASAKAIGGGDRVGVKDIVLVGVDAVGPVASIECLKTKLQT